MFQRSVVKGDLLDASGVDIGIQFLPDRLDQDHKPGHLDAAPGTARAGADKHQQHQHRLAGLGPEIKIRRGKTGGGDNGTHLKGGMPQRGKKASVDLYGIRHQNGDRRRKAQFCQ